MVIKEKGIPAQIVESNGHKIKCYLDFGNNIDNITVNSFGEEWNAFHKFSEDEIKRGGDLYFDVIGAEMIGHDKIGIDFGCGSGRWTKYIRDKMGAIAAIDPSKSIFSASTLLKDASNVQLYKASVDSLPFEDDYFDFGFSLGVLHHIPDTQKAMKDCVKKIKPGGFFLVYLYYNFDNRSYFFKLLFYLSNLVRLVICRLPGRLKRFVCDLLAIFIYMPFVGLGRLLRFTGINEKIRQRMPLHIYEDATFYNIRTDSLDRFGTPLEQRFSKQEINNMMINAGLTEIIFSQKAPYWHAVGKKK